MVKTGKKDPLGGFLKKKGVGLKKKQKI